MEGPAGRGGGLQDSGCCPVVGGEAGGDAGASGLQALNLLFRKRVAQETSRSLPPARCSATPDFPRPRAAVTADRDVRPPGRKPKAGFAGFAGPGRHGRPCPMAAGLEQPRGRRGRLHGQHRAACRKHSLPQRRVKVPIKLD